MSQTMSQDDSLPPRPPTGLMDLATEIRLMIFEEVFQKAVGNAIRHPLLYVCHATRVEYIAAISGKISLYMAGWCSPFESQKPNPTFIIRRNSNKKLLLPRRVPGYILRLSGISDVHDTYIPPWLREDFEAFAESPFSWWIHHLESVVFEVFILEGLISWDAFIGFKIERKDCLTPMALTRSNVFPPG